MHDTNHKEFFSADYRFQSSGCTRVEGVLERWARHLDRVTQRLAARRDQPQEHPGAVLDPDPQRCCVRVRERPGA